jgi:hypothetical protein
MTFNLKQLLFCFSLVFLIGFIAQFVNHFSHPFTLYGYFILIIMVIVNYMLIDLAKIWVRLDQMEEKRNKFK